MENNKYVMKEEITVSQTLTNYIFAIVTLMGALGFLIVGISSYLNFNIIPFLDASEIIFFPQGIVMTAYGSIGIIISSYQFLIMYWKVGDGYNEFDKTNNKMTIFRKGFPGKNSEIKIINQLTDIMRFNKFIHNKKLNLILINKIKSLF